MFAYWQYTTWAPSETTELNHYTLIHMHRKEVSKPSSSAQKNTCVRKINLWQCNPFIQVMNLVQSSSERAYKQRWQMDAGNRVLTCRRSSMICWYERCHYHGNIMSIFCDRAGFSATLAKWIP